MSNILKFIKNLKNKQEKKNQKESIEIETETEIKIFKNETDLEIFAILNNCEESIMENFIKDGEENVVDFEAIYYFEDYY